MLLGLPKATELSKQLPKKAIYEQFNMNTAAKAKFDADISRITIVGEITPNKVNIPAGDKVKNFFVLLVSLKRNSMKRLLQRCQSLFLRTFCLYWSMAAKASLQFIIQR